ncbi:hypothetical protein KUTeg_004696 [Tegillarca granosa]|uniref:Tc1-like transposase DDE domain-containing protein n=1 Tax=Tegillarca granosa TaxID=220873 RepID=A0ABQ9FHK9_TEGGR|nr:hypothetical protein KUTeg_004696 [Tegillarca granosa]
MEEKRHPRMVQETQRTIYRRHGTPKAANGMQTAKLFHHLTKLILREHGHKILRLPPYHAYLNPIEVIWADLKSYVGSKNLKFNLSEVQQLTEKHLKEISTEKWKKNIELEYWKNDIAVDEEIEKNVINLEDTDSIDDETDKVEEDEEEEASIVTAEETTITEETTETADEILL